MTIAQIQHDSKIDWLELSETAHQLLFRDKKMRLILAEVATGRKQTLLVKVSFVQWVTQSDVAVAQSEDQLAVWYNIDMPELVTLMAVRGEVVEVERFEVRKCVLRVVRKILKCIYCYMLLAKSLIKILIKKCLQFVSIKK